MSHKAQKILNYYNATKNLNQRENKRINKLHEKTHSDFINMNFENIAKQNDIVRDEYKIFNQYDINDTNKGLGFFEHIIKDELKTEAKLLNKKNKDKIDYFDINDVYKRNIKCFCNVYQEKYKNNINATGFGDFIRGCYFLLNFCDIFNIKLKIVINHPVNYFLKNNSWINQVLSLNIPFFVNNNWDSYYIDKQNNLHSVPGSFITSAFISYIKDVSPVINDTAFIYTIAYPMNNIPQKHKIIMQKIFEPNDEMKLYVSETLNKYKLIKNEYIVFHIRTGDAYLNAEKKELHVNYIKQLLQNINLIVNENKSSNSKYIIISDNNYIKQILLNYFPFILIILNEITHFGEGKTLEREKVKNTMLDFYIISMSKRIYSFSCYDHGTGFSQWCAETYNIPYSCRLIKI